MSFMKSGKNMKGNKMKKAVLAREQIKAYKRKETYESIEKVLVYGITLGWMASMLYLMLILTATLTA